MNDNEHNEKQEDQMEANDTTLTTDVSDEGFWREIWYQARLVWYLLRSPEVPLYLKILPALAVIYVIVPTDLIPDVFPVIGQLDDITALLVGAKIFIELAPQETVARYIQAFRMQAASSEEVGEGNRRSGIAPEDSIIIDGDYEIVEDENNNRAE